MYNFIIMINITEKYLKQETPFEVLSFYITKKGPVCNTKNTL